LQCPTVLGAVVITYTLAEATGRLRFSPETAAAIFLGKVTAWNDPLLAKDNPGAKLPARPIVPIHRSDGSGTTYVFTDYLSKVSPDWQGSVGKGTAGQRPRGVCGKGNAGWAARA